MCKSKNELLWAFGVPALMIMRRFLKNHKYDAQRMGIPRTLWYNNERNMQREL